MEPIEKHSAPLGVVTAAVIASWIAGDWIAEYFFLEGIAAWVVIGVTILVGYLGFGMLYGWWYLQAYKSHQRQQR